MPGGAREGDAGGQQLASASSVGQVAGALNPELDVAAVVGVHLPDQLETRQSRRIDVLVVELDAVVVARQVFCLDAEPDLVVEQACEGFPMGSAPRQTNSCR